MPRTVTITDISDAKLDKVVAGFHAEGAIEVTRQQQSDDQ